MANQRVNDWAVAAKDSGKVLTLTGMLLELLYKIVVAVLKERLDNGMITFRKIRNIHGAANGTPTG